MHICTLFSCTYYLLYTTHSTRSIRQSIGGKDELSTFSFELTLRSVQSAPMSHFDPARLIPPRPKLMPTTGLRCYVVLETASDLEGTPVRVVAVTRSIETATLHDGPDREIVEAPFFDAPAPPPSDLFPELPSGPPTLPPEFPRPPTLPPELPQPPHRPRDPRRPTLPVIRPGGPRPPPPDLFPPKTNF